MNIDEAINKAADHIEQYPESYNFGQGMVVNKGWTGFGPNPGPGGPRACMLARIGEMAGMPVGTSCETVAREILGTPPEVFYQRIRDTTRREGSSSDPVHDARTIPAAMRKVARQYTGIPLQVRQIFDPLAHANLAHYRTNAPIRPRHAGVGTIWYSGVSA